MGYIFLVRRRQVVMSNIKECCLVDIRASGLLPLWPASASVLVLVVARDTED